MAFVWSQALQCQGNKKKVEYMSSVVLLLMLFYVNFIASCLSNQSLNVGLDVILHQNQKAYLDHFEPKCKTTLLCFPCPQPVPPSTIEQSQVWLTVNEDGLCVLDYTMVSFKLSRRSCHVFSE